MHHIIDPMYTVIQVQVIPGKIFLCVFTLMLGPKVFAHSGFGGFSIPRDLLVIKNNVHTCHGGMRWSPPLLSLSLPERVIGVKLTYGPVGDAPMSIPAFKFFKTDLKNYH